MWTFKEVVRIETDFGFWHALVTLTKDGIDESFYIKFDNEPTMEQAQNQGERLAFRKTLEDSPTADSDSIPREVFLDRFTASEFTRIYAAAQANQDVFMYVKKLELNPTVNRNSPILRAGLQALEDAGLLDHTGRADEILGW